jgi:hypothetical protein
MVGQLDLHRAFHKALGQLGQEPPGPGDLVLRRRAGEQSSVLFVDGMTISFVHAYTLPRTDPEGLRGEL